MKLDPPICQICKELIWNFICRDCIRKDIKKWLPSGLSGRFKKFNNTFSSHFNPKFLPGFEKCIRCNSEKEFLVCPFCYMNEAFYWLKVTNKGLTKKFAVVFNFDFENSGRKEFTDTKKIRFVTNMENPKLKFGICDECGEYSEDLVLRDGEWICIDCSGE